MKISELENFKQMQYAKRFVFKAPKLNVVEIKSSLRKYEKMVYKLQIFLHNLEDQNDYHHGILCI